MILTAKGNAYTVYDRKLAADLGANPGARIWIRHYVTDNGNEVSAYLVCHNYGILAGQATIKIESPEGTHRGTIDQPPMGGIRRAMTEALTRIGHTVLEPVGSKMGEKEGDS